eukprot:CAMPEP_0183829512 /NCGR_PEP_ID=MMETSP0807_2-20130328/3365_1 /TAXON_ID=88271 /ORGANISM="Picocystis salinarum, Strain CCMP1897" /LENGTH=270 /DNA_ID=CAMNT_0026074737 /DNA_START=276 /DNA_END=1089 /DNA_ORIENTATION=+
MYFCIPTLKQMYRERRSVDAVVFTAAFVASVLYHICSVMEGGLLGARLCGMECTTIRDLDILSAQFVLARTYNFLLGVEKPWVGAISAFTFPLVIAFHAMADTLTLRLAGQALLTSLLLTTLFQIAFQGIKPFHFHSKRYWSMAMGFYVLGFLSFVQPNKFPEQYWLWHSLWHVFMSVGYFYLYCRAPLKLEMEQGRAPLGKAAEYKKMQGPGMKEGGWESSSTTSKSVNDSPRKLLLETPISKSDIYQLDMHEILPRYKKLVLQHQEGE